MKTLLFSLILIILPFRNESGLPKIFQTNSAQSSMIIAGTSTLHDWEMEASNLNGSMDLEINKSTVDLKSLKLTVPVKALKSGKSAMDNNAYKALKTEQHHSIKYELVSVSEQQKLSNGNYKMLSRGKLSVAGVSRILRIPITLKSSNNGVEISGTTTFNMSDFKVEPPSFMMGAVSTGDEITIKFSINYN